MATGHLRRHSTACGASNAGGSPPRSTSAPGTGSTTAALRPTGRSSWYRRQRTCPRGLSQDPSPIRCCPARSTSAGRHHYRRGPRRRVPLAASALSCLAASRNAAALPSSRVAWACSCAARSCARPACAVRSQNPTARACAAARLALSSAIFASFRYSAAARKNRLASTCSTISGRRK
jgi:hypothetical protein